MAVSRDRPSAAPWLVGARGFWRTRQGGRRPMRPTTTCTSAGWRCFEGRHTMFVDELDKDRGSRLAQLNGKALKMHGGHARDRALRLALQWVLQRVRRFQDVALCHARFCAPLPRNRGRPFRLKAEGGDFALVTEADRACSCTHTGRSRRRKLDRSAFSKRTRAPTRSARGRARTRVRHDTVFGARTFI